MAAEPAVSAREVRQGFRNIEEFVIVMAFDRREFLSLGVLLAARRPKGTRRLQSVPVVDSPAPVAELVDALDSGSSGRKPVEVRVLSGALSATPYGTPCTAQVLKLVDRPD